MTAVGSSRIGFGDNVRVRDTDETRAAGIAGVYGSVYGETTPSATAVKVIGSSVEDFALNVQPQEGGAFWIVMDLLDFIDHGAGTEIVVGNVRAVRRTDGSWDESVVKPNAPWWKFW